jgi:hypothetical protein
LSVLSSFDMPPLKKWMPGTAAGMLQSKHPGKSKHRWPNVSNSKISKNAELFGHLCSIITQLTAALYNIPRAGTGTNLHSKATHVRSMVRVVYLATSAGDAGGASRPGRHMLQSEKAGQAIAEKPSQ